MDSPIITLWILEWRWNTADNGMLHRQIISYFGDSASPQSPFSIQKLISVGRESGRKAGDWYGPASIANALRYGDFCTLLTVNVIALCCSSSVWRVISLQGSACSKQSCLPVNAQTWQMANPAWYTSPTIATTDIQEQGHCGACRRKWRLTDTDLCPCGETQTMSHIVESCPMTKLNGGLSRLHSVDEDAVSWLTNYG